MKLKDYLDWKHQKGGKKKNGNTRRKRKNHDHDTQGK